MLGCEVFRHNSIAENYELFGIGNMSNYSMITSSNKHQLHTIQTEPKNSTTEGLYFIQTSCTLFATSIHQSIFSNYEF